MSKNKVALGIASAVIGFTGVAGASVAVSQKTTSDDHGHEASIAADAGLVSFTGNAGGALADIPGLPSLPSVEGLIDMVTGAAGGDIVGSVTGNATGAVNSATGLVQGAAGMAGSVIPFGGAAGLLSSCAATQAVPKLAPLPMGAINEGLAQLNQAEALVNMVSGLTADLPIKVPALLSASDVFSAVRGQINCAGAMSAQSSPLPAACAIKLGLPVDLPEPAKGAVNGILKDLSTTAGQSLTTGAGSGVNMSCDGSAATQALGGAVQSASNPANILSSVQATAKSIVPNVAVPKVDIPALPAIPALPGIGAGVPDLGGVVGTVTGVVDSATNLVGGVAAGGVPNLPIDLNGILSGILPSSCSTSASGGLLGSLTAVLSANCS